MTRLALLLSAALLAPAALAQTPDLVGAWTVERATDTAAPPATDGVGPALFPENPFAFSPLRLSFDASGGAVVVLLVPRTDGYERVEVPSTYRLAGDRLVLHVDGVRVEAAVALSGDALVLTSEGTEIALRRE